MTKSFECQSGGVQCNARITGETEEEVLQQAVEHARDAHGVDLTSSQTLARYAAGLIRDDDAPAAQPDEDPAPAERTA